MSKEHDRKLEIWASRRERIRELVAQLGPDSMGRVGRRFRISRQRVRQIVNGKGTNGK